MSARLQVSQLTLEKSDGIHLKKLVSIKCTDGRAEVKSHLLNGVYSTCALAPSGYSFYWTEIISNIDTHQKVRTPHTICIEGSHILGETTCSIRLSGTSHINKQRFTECKPVLIYWVSCPLCSLHCSKYYYKGCSKWTTYPHVKRVLIFCKWSIDKSYRILRGLTLKSVPCMLSSSFMPETYALDTLERSRSWVVQSCESTWGCERKYPQFVKYYTQSIWVL